MKTDHIKWVALHHKVIGGHLLQHMIPHKAYEFTQEGKHFAGSIIDETGHKVYISNNCIKAHLRIVT